MNLTHIEHLGIAVKSLETAIPYYESVLGLKCYAVEEVAEQKVKTAFFKVGQTKIPSVSLIFCSGVSVSFAIEFTTVMDRTVFILDCSSSNPLFRI